MQEIETIFSKLKSADSSSLGMSIGDAHAKGLFSLVFHGVEAGNLTRAFIAGRKVKPFDAQLHSHSYDLKITVLKGRVTHHVARILKASSKGGLKMPAYKYQSPLTGGDGVLSYSHNQLIMVEEYVIPPGATLELSHKDIHTISCSKGAIWVVEEFGFEAEETIVLGSPFCTDNLYRKPKKNEINNNFQKLRRATQTLLSDHLMGSWICRNVIR